ncbi:MAG: hypothetical protein KH828_13520 [Clostridiales bacterium]|nr:hypothetical protein [Clostridiales bacterium]
MTEWKVCFEKSFWGNRGHGCAGKEISIGKSFLWDKEEWLVLSAYVCKAGLVLDICKKIPERRIQEFIEKWNLSAEDDDSRFSEDIRIQIENDNPLNTQFRTKLTVNGTHLQRSCAYGTTWNPCLKEKGESEKNIIEHYGLDPSFGWSIHRISFPWKTKKQPESIETLELFAEQEMQEIPGPHFRVKGKGDSFSFTHPITGTDYTLTVQQYEPQKQDFKQERYKKYEFPSHYYLMGYTLSPELSDDHFFMADCVKSDPPVEKKFQEDEGRVKKNLAVAAIIGGADGPTVITLVGKKEKQPMHMACSALHFQKAEDVEWRIVFREKNREDITVRLLPEE